MKKNFPYTFPFPHLGFYGCEINCNQKTNEEIWELVLEIVEKSMEGIFLPLVKQGEESYQFRFFSCEMIIFAPGQFGIRYCHNMTRKCLTVFADRSLTGLIGSILE